MADEEPTPKPGACVQAGGTTITFEDVLLQLKSGSGAEFLEGLVRRKLAAAIVKKRGIALTDEEIEGAEVEFFSDRNLFEAQQILDWLKSMRLEKAEVRNYIAEIALVERSKPELVSDDKVEERFAAERHAYARAQVDVFKFVTIGKAKEFILAVREAEFTPAGGAFLELTYRDAPEEIAGELFSAEPGDLIGPVENDDGSYSVYLLHQRTEAALDDELKEEIRDEMFEELLDAELARAPIKFLR